MSNILRIPPRRTSSISLRMDLDLPQITTINQLVAPSSEPDLEEEYATDDEEVDEIIDDDPPPLPRKLNGKAKAKATPNTLTPSTTSASAEPPKVKTEPEILPLPFRKPGETHVEQQRVEKIIKAHGDMLPPSKDAVFLISLAAEEFIKRLAGTGHRHAMDDQRKVIDQRDMALAAQTDHGYSFLRETVPTAIPLALALQKHAQKENERTLIATELTQFLPMVGNGTSAHSHKKRQPPLPKPPVGTKGKTRTSTRHANGRPSAAVAASASAPVSAASSPRPKRAAAQKGRESWAQAEEDAPEYEDEEPHYPLHEGEPMDLDGGLVHWKVPSRQGFSSVGPGRGGMMKGFGPGAYGKVGGLALGGTTRSASASPGVVAHGSSAQRLKGSWGFPPEPPRNTGRTIYSDRTDEEARKAAVEAEEQLRYKRARQKIEQELMVQDVPDGQLHPRERTSDA